ncbi:MAG: hypothetical protein ABIB43_04470 [archaeon]
MRKTLILTFVLLLILASCTTNTVTPSNERSFIGGTIGLLVNFVESEPPYEVTDGGEMPFTVSIKLENKGETEISRNDVLISLKGFDAPSFGTSASALVNQHPTEDILKNDINPDTGESINSPPVFFTFSDLNYGDSLAGNSVFPFVVDVCYKYQSKATSKLCIKENVLSSTDDVCIVTGPKEVQNSGAPVQIISFDEFTAGKSAVSFSFKVKNVGNGLLSRASSACDQTTVAKDYVKISVDTGLSGLTCSGLSGGNSLGTAYVGEVKLSTGERQIRCTQQLTPVDMVDKVMIVDMVVDYDYEESTRTDVLVKHI